MREEGKKRHARIEEPHVLAGRKVIDVVLDSRLLVAWTGKLYYPCQYIDKSIREELT
jgi:hypothetical protein